MTIKECYEKFKHLDIVISDAEWIGADPKLDILRDMWLAIKEAAKKEVADENRK